MPTLTIDNNQITVHPGQTILDAATKLGIRIPTLCHLQGHPATTSCMVCVVKVNGSARLLPACATRAEEGMVVESESDEVHAARRTALELLLGDHLGDCVGPCQTACPAHMDIPLMITHIAAGRNREAIQVIKEHIAIPAILGRVCPEICEKACRRAAKDKAVSICLLKRFAADVDLASPAPYTPNLKPATGKRAAVIGAGPAGLSAAYYLLREGVACTIFDQSPLPGGTLRTDVPSAKLPPEVIDTEAAAIESMGAKFKLGTAIDSLVGLADYDAIIITTGANSPTFGLPTTEHGLKVDRHTHMTGTPGVFAAGSAITPHKHAVRAAAEGRSAALAAAAYLAGVPFEHHARPYTVRIGRLAADELAIFAAEASHSARLNPGADGFKPTEAAAEATRCLHCECAKLDACKLRDHATDYAADPGAFKGERRRFVRDSEHPLLVHEPGKCISCGICVALAEESNEPLGLTFTGRGFGVQISVPFGESLSEGLKVAARKCAESCPTGALSLRTK